MTRQYFQSAKLNRQNATVYFAAPQRIRRTDHDQPRKHAGLLDGTGSIIATPSGGLHAYFNASGQPSGNVPSRDLDFKAGGGYVAAAPSRMNARTHRLLAKQEPGTCRPD